MSAPLRRRAPLPSRARRNIRWAVIALLALLLAPTGSREADTPQQHAAGGRVELAEVPNPLEGWPWIASESMHWMDP